MHRISAQAERRGQHGIAAAVPDWVQNGEPAIDAFFAAF
jgi:hypothetical protein